MEFPNNNATAITETVMAKYFSEMFKTYRTIKPLTTSEFNRMYERTYVFFEKELKAMDVLEKK